MSESFIVDMITAYSKEKEAKKIAEAKREEERNQYIAELFEKTFGHRPNKVDSGTVLIEGRELIYKDTNKGDAWILMGECPICHQWVGSEPCHNAIEIGEMFVKFQPSQNHYSNHMD